MTEGRNWHWRSYGILQFLLPVVGVCILLLSLWLYADESYKGPALPVVLFLCGLWFLGRKYFLGLKFANSVKKMPSFGKKVVWSFSENEFQVKSDLSDSKILYSALFKTVITPAGFLLYPQKEIYHWVPKSCFSDTAAFDKVKEFLEGNTTSKCIGKY